MSAALKLDRMFVALADPTRRGVVELLRKKPHRAGELAEAMAMSPPAMSRHLRLLRSSGLVEEASIAEDARVSVYRLRHEPFVALRSWLDDVEEFWGGQLDSFKAHAEKRVREKENEKARRKS